MLLGWFEGIKAREDLRVTPQDLGAWIRPQVFPCVGKLEEDQECVCVCVCAGVSSGRATRQELNGSLFDVLSVRFW